MSILRNAAKAHFDEANRWIIQRDKANGQMMICRIKDSVIPIKPLDDTFDTIARYSDEDAAREAFTVFWGEAAMRAALRAMADPD